ncbi:MAG TPA: hypothetical protein PKJ33_02955 [Alphaproteobacteria bacterium]|nr:hypothetical protein [Alphaproteobacteria bacterium]
MIKSVFDLIKKQNGETFAKAIRNYDNGIFDIPDIVEIVKYAGRDAEPILKYLGSLKKIEIKDSSPETEKPFELLQRAGYHAEYADNLKKQNSIKKYFKSNEELCTFRDDSRYQRYYILNAVRYDVDNIIRENFTQPRREDDYGTSVISIQVLKTGGFISIKNRYNHSVDNPDNTFGSNPDNIIDGLSASIRQYFNVDFSSSETFLPGGYTFINNKIIQFNTEVNNIYFGNDFFVQDGIVHEIDNDSEIMLDNFVFNLKNQWLVDIADTNDDFIPAFEENIKDKKIKIIKNNADEKIILADEQEIVKVYNGRIITVSFPNTKVFKGQNQFLRNSNFVQKISLPEVENFPPYSNNYIPSNPSWYMPIAHTNWEKEVEANGGNIPIIQSPTRKDKVKSEFKYRAKKIKEFVSHTKITLHGIIDAQNCYGNGWLYFTPVDEQEKVSELKKSKFNTGVTKLKKPNISKTATISQSR